MKIRLKVSVKVRGGQVFIPGVYDSENVGHAGLFNILSGNEGSDVFETLDAPVVFAEPTSEIDPNEDMGEEDEVETEETEEEVSEEAEEETVEEEIAEEVEDKPKKKKKKKRVI